jgi:transposase
MIDYNDELAALVASGCTIREAAKRLEIGEATAYRRSEKPQFRQRVNELRAASLAASVGKITSLVDESLDVVRSILQNGSDRDKLAASKIVLSSVGPLSELAELRQRITALETRGLKLHG